MSREREPDRARLSCRSGNFCGRRRGEDLFLETLEERGIPRGCRSDKIRSLFERQFQRLLNQGRFALQRFIHGLV